MTHSYECDFKHPWERNFIRPGIEEAWRITSFHAVALQGCENIHAVDHGLQPLAPIKFSN